MLNLIMLSNYCRYVFGMTHIPRLEDWPVMPVERIGFMLMVFYLSYQYFSLSMFFKFFKNFYVFFFFFFFGLGFFKISLLRLRLRIHNRPKILGLRLHCWFHDYTKVLNPFHIFLYGWNFSHWLPSGTRNPLFRLAQNTDPFWLVLVRNEFQPLRSISVFTLFTPNGDGPNGDEMSQFAANERQRREIINPNTKNLREFVIKKIINK